MKPIPSLLPSGKARVHTPPPDEDRRCIRHILSQFKDGRVIAKMLAGACVEGQVGGDFDRLHRELDELFHKRHISCASTSLLVPDVSSQVFREIGFLIDADRVFIRFISSVDVASMPVNDQGNYVVWDSNKHCYVGSSDGISFESTEFPGRFLANNENSYVSIFDLRSQLTKAYHNQGEELLDVNELIVDYDTEAIMGIVVAVEDQGVLGVKLAGQVEDFCHIVTDHFKRKLPLLFYNRKTGTLINGEGFSEVKKS